MGLGSDHILEIDVLLILCVMQSGGAPSSVLELKPNSVGIWLVRTRANVVMAFVGRA